MTTYVPSPNETGEAAHAGEADFATNHEVYTTSRPALTRRRPRPGAFIFVSGFMLGAVATTVASIVGRGRRAPFVWGNRNVFVSLPFSGISMTAPSVRVKGRRPNGFARFASMSRRMARGKKGAK